MIESAAAKTSSLPKSADLSPEVHKRVAELIDEDWAKFAQEWRNSYKEFTKGFEPGETEWRDIDTHHRLSLIDLLKGWDLDGLYNSHEIEDLSKIWHFLDPWADTSAGLHKLGTKFITSTLSK